MTDKSTNTSKITAKTAKLTKAGTSANKRKTTKYDTLRTKLESPRIGEFGIAAAKQSFLYAGASGPYSVDAVAEAALRADDNVALADFAQAGIGVWHARGLAISVNFASSRGRMLAAFGNPAYFRGLVQIAREHAIQIARTEAKNEGDIFMKSLLAQDYDGFSGLPFYREVAGYLRQMIARDLDVLGIDPETFHARAEKVLARFGK